MLGEGPEASFDARRAVEAAAEAVLRAEAFPAARALAAEVGQMQRDLLTKSKTLNWLVFQKAFPVSAVYGRPVDPEVSAAAAKAEDIAARWFDLKALDGSVPW